MSLVWKLLRQHISIAQFVGFLLANLTGMFIVMLGCQFYCDVMPVFTSEDSFMRQNYLILSKKIGAGNSISGRENAFSKADLDNISHQDCINHVGVFSRAEYKLEATMSIQGKSLINSELFFESVPDEFVDVPLSEWHYQEGAHEVPIILPRSYVAMYNFGFAQTHGLPKISDGLVGMIDVCIYIHGNGLKDNYHGRVIGFSSRLNTILVPQSFMDWSNQHYAPTEHTDPTRMIVEVENPTDKRFSQFIEENALEIEDNNPQMERASVFLRMMVGLVMMVGLIISALSFYILMLSIYLLVQKNSEKLENLLLIGYSPSQTARPYQVLAIALNVVVFILALMALWGVRAYYLNIIESIAPDVSFPTILPALTTGITLLLIVSSLNIYAIRSKVIHIWKHKE